MELLVSAALVVLMLMMFAVIFQIATASLGTQRGIAENDQRARTLLTILHNDIKYRTFRRVIAFDPQEVAPELLARRGYLYISENDLDNDRDDVLALTVDMPGAVPLFGRAGHVFFDESGSPYQNQPVLDGDGNFQNRTASLTTAEVCYFVRGGNLIRRVMLIRRGRGGEELPQTEDGTELFDPTLPTGGAPPTRYPGVFYRDFDYSVYAVEEEDPQSGNDVLKVKFHGDDGLWNGSDSSSRFSLGNPFNRFGFNHETGQPREYVNGPNGANSVFIGRFIHEETSHNRFTYPFELFNNIENPYDRNLNLTDANLDSVVDQYAGGRRRSEDILMTHVHGFDVKLWDDALGRFVDVGHEVAGGDFYQTPESSNTNPADDANNRNQHLAVGIVYGPRAAGQPRRNRVFDTWNPDVGYDPGNGQLMRFGQFVDPQAGQFKAPPPFRPLRQQYDEEGQPIQDEFFALPVRALQITVRYYDVSSDQNRTLTLEFSLLD